MNIKGHTGRLIAVCTITGLVLGSAFVWSHRRVEEQANELGSSSIVLKEVESLKTLSFSNTTVSDLTPLAGLTNLESLTAQYTLVDDVSSLKTLTSLKSLYLDGSPVNEEEVKALRQTLPGLRR